MSRAFRLALRARERLYETGVLTTMRLRHPVVSVGNLTIGGTGKTPLVVALAEALRDRGFRPVILSRGYRRTSRGVLIVGTQEGRWSEWGDEPFLMKQRLGNVAVVVGANRYHAGRLAEEKRLGDIFLLDDGFQHRRLHRDVDIVAIDPAEWIAGENLLPSGRWREPKSALERAHAACIQQMDGVAAPQLAIPSFNVQTEVVGLFADDEPVHPDTLRNREVAAFAGIAKPERFFRTLESIGVHPVQRVQFRDHHHYSARDLDRLGGEVLVTTEKDAVRLRTVTDRTYCYLRISAKIPNLESLMSLILSRLPKS
jgi:tetraacyldisaccharide 4'-kinase